MLLQKTEDGGYPVEYLATRIAVRKCSLTSDWQPLLAVDDPLAAVKPGNFLARSVDRTKEGLWKSLSDEYCWVYRQMDEAARRDFAPFFIRHELKTAILCLRNMQARERGKAGEILVSSLLSQNVKHILAHGEDPATAVGLLEVEFVQLSTGFCGMSENFRARGAGGLEQWLNDTWLEWVCGGALHPVLRDFFVDLVDYRNLMELYKRTHWQTPESSRFLKGGRIGRTTLADALASGDRHVIADFLRRFHGTEGDEDLLSSPEHCLLRGITRRLRGRSRDLAGYAAIIEYLWLLHVETVNLGIVLESGKLGRESAAGEIV